MGLQDFIENGRQAFHDDEDESQQSVDHFKVIKCDRQRKIEVPSEDVWDSIVAVVENEMWLDIDEVLDMEDSHTFQIIHQASLSVLGYDIQTSYPKKECLVCGETYVFPHDWDFTRVRGEVSCNYHSMSEVVEKIERVNQLDYE